MILRTLAAGLLALTVTLPAAAMDGGITVEDPYARASRPNAPTGAAFMTILNHGAEDDRLIAAASDAAERVELHTHIEDAEGVLRMIEVEDGIAIPAGGTALLARGGDHVMMMGLTKAFTQGATVTVTLTFEVGGEMTLEIPVDNDRKPAGHGVSHGHGHGAATN